MQALLGSPDSSESACACMCIGMCEHVRARDSTHVRACAGPRCHPQGGAQACACMCHRPICVICVIAQVPHVRACAYMCIGMCAHVRARDSTHVRACAGPRCHPQGGCAGMCVHVQETDMRGSHKFRMCGHVRACASGCARMRVQWIHQNTAHMTPHMAGHDAHSSKSIQEGPHRPGTCLAHAAHMRAHDSAKTAAHTPTQGYRCECGVRYRSRLPRISFARARRRWRVPRNSCA